MMGGQLAGQHCRCAVGPWTRPQQRSHTPAAALSHGRRRAQSALRQQRQIACAAAAAEYSSAPASNFASLDSLELERLHTQLRSACSWLDISASVADFGSMMVDEASVVAALVRLAAIYSHLGESDRSDVRASGLVERLAAMTERRLPALTPQQLADVLDALARLEFHAPASFLRAADRQAQESLPDFAPSQLPLLLCALVALGQEPGAALVDALGEALAHQDLAVAPSDVARMLCALAALAGSPPPQALLKGLGSALRRQLDSFRPAELSQALGAMAKLKFHPGSDVLRRIAARAGMRRPAHAARPSGPRSAGG